MAALQAVRVVLLSAMAALAGLQCRWLWVQRRWGDHRQYARVLYGLVLLGAAFFVLAGRLASNQPFSWRVPVLTVATAIGLYGFFDMPGR